ncbi:MAG: SNF2-related protein, partial [Verrucomicrobiota bacterium]
MKTPSAKSNPRTPPTNPPRGGILSQIRLTVPPFKGEIFRDEDLSAAASLLKTSKVEIVAANLQEEFAGVFGQVTSDGSRKPAEVSVVIQKTTDGEWRFDGRSDQEAGKNRSHAAAVLMAAMLESADATEEQLGIASQGFSIHLFAADVRAGILHWDDSEAKAVLENMSLARVQEVDRQLEERLREMGLKPLVELYPWDEIEAGYRECYGYSAVRRGMQEVFWADFLTNRKSELERLGCSITVDPDFGLEIVEPSQFYGELREERDQVDWFSFEYGLQLGDERVNLLPCLVRYLESRPASFTLDSLRKMKPGARVPIPMGDSGNYVPLPVEKLLTILEILTELFDHHVIGEDGSLRVHPLRAAQLANQDGEVKLVNSVPEALECFADSIESLKPREIPDVSADFLAELRPYQQDGFEWLQFLREQKLGGILADDMGLGKTVQTLCHLHHEKRSGRCDLPSLIVAPKSVVPNWEKEVRKFAPSMKVLVLQGASRKKYYPVLEYSDLVITSYPVLLRDAEELLSKSFHYVVLDEAQMIKNTHSQITRVAFRLDARHRLCLSGTPIENHLGELWSVFQFLMPGFLGSEESFNRCFRFPIENDRDEGLRKRLSERVAPLMLRRTKNLVATDLPPKTEIVRRVELSASQVEIYEAVRAAVSREVHEEIERLGIERSKLLVLDALLKLRQVCNDPRLIKLPSAQKA